MSLQVRAFDHLLTTSNTLATLMRYETKFERQYDRAFRGWVVYQEKQGRREMQQLAREAPLPVDIAPSQELARLLPIEIQERLSRITGLALPRPPLTESAASVNFPGEPNAAFANSRPARNAPCPCGSGKKYKRCCERDTPSTTP